MHKDTIGKWAENRQRSERLNVYRMLKQEFQGELKGRKINCKHCENEYEVKVFREGNEFIHLSHPFGIKWSLFLQGYFGVFFNEIVGLVPEVDVLSSSITFTVNTKDIERITSKKRE